MICKFQGFLKFFLNGSLANIEFSKTQLPKMMQSSGCIMPNVFDPTNPSLLFPSFRMISSLSKSSGKELGNKDPKK